MTDKIEFSDQKMAISVIYDPCMDDKVFIGADKEIPPIIAINILMEGIGVISGHIKKDMKQEEINKFNISIISHIEKVLKDYKNVIHNRKDVLIN